MSYWQQKFWYLAGLLTLILGWELLSVWISPMVLTGPVETLIALFHQLFNGVFWQQLGISLTRLLLALLLGATIGFGLGLAAGRRPKLKFFLEPFRWFLMSIPPVIVVLLAMLWFGMGTEMVIFIVVALLAPTVYINTLKGIEMIDPKWLELAQVYGFSRWQRLTRVYIPAISAPLTATLVIVCCNGVRILVLAEVLGTHDGMGYQLANARSSFDTAELYAWVVVSLLIVAALEFLLLKPVQRSISRWHPWN